MTACGEGSGEGGEGSGEGGGGSITVNSTNGTLTISEIPTEYNGKWLYAVGLVDEYFLIAAQNVTSSSIQCAPISNGTATLKVWKETEVSENEVSLDNYNGSDQNVEFFISVFNKQTLTQAEAEAASSGEEMPDFIVGFGAAEVDFTSGDGSGTFNDFFEE